MLLCKVSGLYLTLSWSAFYFCLLSMQFIFRFCLPDFRPDLNPSSHFRRWSLHHHINRHLWRSTTILVVHIQWIQRPAVASKAMLPLLWWHPAISLRLEWFPRRLGVLFQACGHHGHPDSPWPESQSEISTRYYYLASGLSVIVIIWLRYSYILNV